MANYSGNLVRTYAQPDDAAPASVFKPDPAHGKMTTDAADPYAVRHQVPADTGIEYAGTDFPFDMAIGGGVILDTPSWESHDGPVVAYPVYTDDQMREVIPRGHAGEDGGWKRHHFAVPEVQGHTEVYGETLVEGFTNQPVNAPFLTRGINSYPLNNPEREGYVNGFRPGVWRQLVAYRDRFQHRRRFHYDIQPLSERADAVRPPVDRPALPGGQPYYGPFFDGWMRTGLLHREVQPRMYQAAEPIDASLLATPATDVSSVIGGDVI